MVKKAKPAPGPDDLVRSGPGGYRSGDDRFEVQKSDQRWFIVDTQQANEFGQQLIHGPFATLDDVRGAIPASRDIKPLLRTPRRAAAAKLPAGPSRKPAAPTSWIDRLPAKEADEVRDLIHALDGAGVADADALVRRDRDSPFALVAAALIEQPLKTLLGDGSEVERQRQRRMIKRVVEILTDDGVATARPLPRWELVETPRDTSRPPRPARPRP
ncbi:MAG: hypothetical protein ABI452_00570 [Candidatus Limnocylindrales bacterium]